MAWIFELLSRTFALQYFLALQQKVVDDFTAFAKHVLQAYESQGKVAFDNLDDGFKSMCREWLLANGYTNDVVEHYVEYFHELINAWHRDEDMDLVHKKYMIKSAVDLDDLVAEQDALQQQFEDFLLCIAPGDIERAREIHAEVMRATDPYMPANG